MNVKNKKKTEVKEKSICYKDKKEEEVKIEEKAA
jgi:hypothetical protein